MKKVFIFFVALIALLLLAVSLIPVLFKDDIKALVDKQIDQNINASVFYDVDNLSLSLFSHFPSLTVGLSDFGVVGKEPFQNDTLAAIGSFEVALDIMSVISGDQITINSIYLYDPKIKVKVLADGTANYDIAKATSEETPSDTAATGSDISIGIKYWEIVNGQFIYDDQSLQVYNSLLGINHEGNGDFAANVFDMTSITEIESINLIYEGAEYLSDKRLFADITMAMDLNESRYTFKENRVQLNELGLGFDGSIAMPSESIELDLQFSSQENTFKNVLSLIPSMFLEGFEDLETNGNFTLVGSISGKYDDTNMPGYNLKLEVNNGYVKYPEYPVPIDNIALNMAIDNPTGQQADFTMEMSNFRMNLDGEPIEARLKVQNLDQIQWDAYAKGKLDLDKMSKVFPQEGTTMAGIVNANLATSGNVNSLEREAYEEIDASGNIAIDGLKYISNDLPQGFAINSSAVDFSPASLKINDFDAQIGKSDMKVTGFLSNYLAYVLNDEMLKGSMTLTSTTLDLNEWMTDKEEAESDSDTSSLEVFKVPENIDFEFRSSIGQVLYDNLTLNNVAGLIIVRDGAVSMQNVNFRMLEGDFRMDGAYITKNMENPVFRFDFGAAAISVSESYKAFNMVQALAPVAQHITGDFSTDFTISGALGKDMMPIYSSLSGGGLVEVAQAALKEMRIMEVASSLTKMDFGTNENGNVNLRDILMKAEIKQGKLFIDPFDVKLGDRTATIAGSSGIDGSLDYIFSTTVPTGAAGTAINNALSQFTGSSVVGDNIDLNLKITGTYDDPKIGIASAKPSAGVAKASVKAALSDEVNAQKAKVEAEAKEEIDKRKEEAKEKLDAEAEKLEDKAKEELNKLMGGDSTAKPAEEVKDALKGLFNKKKKGGG